MIYLKNNTETQSIYIPRQTVLGGGYIPSTKAYDKGYNDGLEVGKEQQKDKLSNLNVTENGQYEREDGWNVVNVDVPDLNGSYNEGYEQGKTEGIDEQKGKLESINITENGVYSKEDGYNHIEVNVPSYEQGQADMAAKARVLNVTENGVYKTKFSDPIMPTLVTGVYADGNNFYNYAELNGKVFNTKIAATIDSRLEFWYKGDNKVSGDAYNTIIGAGNDNSKSEKFQILYNSTSNNQLLVEIGNSLNRVIAWDDDRVWHHLILSKAEGLLIDGEKKADFSPTNTVDGEFFINGVAHVIKEGNNRIANGCFGMIKIDDVVIIPTADGFLNTNTGELLEVVKDGGYTFTENLPIYGEGELYKTINVNVPDLNGSYDEGKTDGINEQKSKLETINITVNGTYNREDGYNHIEVNVPTEAVSCNLEDKWVTPSMNDRDSNGFIVVRPSEGYDGLSRTVIDPKTIYYEGAEVSSQIQETKLVKPSINDLDVNGYIVVMPSKGYAAMGRVVIDVSTIKSEWTTIGKNSITDYDITAFTYKVYDWTSVNINRDNMTNDCGDRPLDCLLFRNRSGECTVMTKLDTCSGTVRLENGWSGDSIILSLKSNSVTKFSSNSINSNQLTSIDTGFAKLEGNAITNCNALTDIKVTVLNDDLSTQFATNCFNGLPAEGTITISKNVDVTITITDDEITSFFRTIVGEGWTITIK